ncbi:hypothetical protein HMPREF1022_00155 [Desulfovibrio sp. 6_1_46AFAA]|uniref:hypothetical protein n=1 Tax=Desulfovibrio sp. 6_1_46AFAA TaxID=665942 RepID=UPI0002236E20|nr:hypothetical protein [Desulfovibrio sp. 6_1_46AFAA]EGW49642.1 hypothetical protein HMPREF1022_00155 [Desulfovibrio sp. 6_1_46AFAA]
MKRLVGFVLVIGMGMPLVMSADAAQMPDLTPRTIEQARLRTKWIIESGIQATIPNIDHSLTARIKCWWNAEDEEPVSDAPADGQISDEKLEDVRKSVDALLN